MNLESGDVIYAVIVLGVAVLSYRVVRSGSNNALFKIIATGGGYAVLLDFHDKFGWELYASQDWLWQVASPDRSLVAGAVFAIALSLRDRYAQTITEAGIAVRFMKADAEAELAQQRREAEADLSRQYQESKAKIQQEVQTTWREIEQEELAAREELQREMTAAREHLDNEREQLRREREDALRERNKAKQRDPYEILDIGRDTTPQEIKKRYRELMSQYHPDKAAQTTPEICKLAEEKVKDINWAFEQLRE